MSIAAETINDTAGDETVAVCQIHGRGHSPWHFHRTIPLFETLGHPTITPELPIEEPGQSFDSYAEVVCEHIIASGYKRVALAAHSMGGNVAIRVPEMLERMTAARDLGSIAVPTLIYVAASLETSTLGWLPAELRDSEDQRLKKNGVLYLAAEQEREDGKYTLDTEIAEQTFYSACTDDDRKEAASHLRPYYKVTGSVLENQPNVPGYYLFTKTDFVIYRKWQTEVANFLDIPKQNRYEVGLGHSPMYSVPFRYVNAVTEAIAGRLVSNIKDE